MVDFPAKFGELYQDLETLGEGGFGAVYRGRRIGEVEQIAIKILHATHGPTSEDDHGRFRREYKILSRLRCPNVVSVFDAWFDGGASWYEMELCLGGTLKERIDKGLFSWPRGKDAFRATALSLLEALQYYHAHGLIHRDLKPQNILFRSKDASASPVVADFGLARYEFRRISDGKGGTTFLSQRELVAGTVDYIAPETIEFSTATIQSDLFATGTILYQMLTGRTPYRWAKTDTDQRILLRKMGLIEPADNQYLPRPTLEALGVPGNLVDFIERALKFKPEDRFQTPAEMERALLSALPIIDEATLLAAEQEKSRRAAAELDTRLRKSMEAEASLATRLKKAESELANSLHRTAALDTRIKNATQEKTALDTRVGNAEREATVRANELVAMRRSVSRRMLFLGVILLLSLAANGWAELRAQRSEEEIHTLLARVTSVERDRDIAKAGMARAEMDRDGAMAARDAAREEARRTAEAEITRIQKEASERVRNADEAAANAKATAARADESARNRVSAEITRIRKEAADAELRAQAAERTAKAESTKGEELSAQLRQANSDRDDERVASRAAAEEVRKAKEEAANLIARPHPEILRSFVALAVSGVIIKPDSTQAEATPGSNASRKGFPNIAKVLGVNGQAVDSYAGLLRAFADSKGESVSLEYQVEYGTLIETGRYSVGKYRWDD